MADLDKQGLTRVDIIISDNVWWVDQFQFGDPIDFSWTLAGASFYLAIKVDDDDATARATYTSAAGQIVVADAVNRILGMNVTDIAIRAALAEGDYVYDLIMVNASTGQTDGLMYGKLHVAHGITVGPS